MTEKYFPALSPVQHRQFSLLPTLYARWNEKINVVSRKDIDNFDVNHLLHSLAIAKFINFRPGSSVIDVGTGGGLPGIPLAIFFPDVKFTLVDSVAKKIRVADAIASEAGLKNVTTITARAESVKGKYDFVTGRAVTGTEQFIRLTRHLVSPRSSGDRKNGWILLKGGDLETELGHLGGTAEITAISEWFDEPWFETKKVVYIPL